MPESLRWPLLPHDDPPPTPPSTPPKSPRLDRRCKTRIERPLLPLRVHGSADELTLLGSLRSPLISIPCRLSPIASPPVLHQRHLGRGAATIEQSLRTKTCIVTRSRTSNRPMPFSLAG